MENNTQPPVSSPTPPQIPVEPTVPTSKPNLLVISLVIVEIITLLVTGYFAYQVTLLKKELAIQPSPTPTFQPAVTEVPSISSPKPSSTPDETANWKTYNETQYGVSFKYQPSQVVNKNEYNSTYGGKEIVLSTKYNGNGFDWFIEENKNGVSFDTYLKDWTSQQGFTSFTDKTVSGISGKLAEIAGYTGQLDADNAHLEFYAMGKNNYLYRLRLYTNKMTITNSDKQFFNTILGSVEIR